MPLTRGEFDLRRRDVHAAILWFLRDRTPIDLRLQIQTDPRYGAFVSRAQPRDVLGWTLNVADVADVADVLQGKIWAASDPTRRGSKRLKDFADIARILESYPELAERDPPEIQKRLNWLA